MKKIFFNDKYGLTQAVLEMRKTMTRRFVPCEVHPFDTKENLLKYSRYKIGEEVAIAQRYSDVENLPFDRKYDIEREGKERAGWNNKMFVEAIYMPHRIRITDIKVERLQDISDEDCLKEGICKAYYMGNGRRYYMMPESGVCYLTPREAFAALIDKVSGKGTWKKNPFVFAYCFEL